MKNILLIISVFATVCVFGQNETVVKTEDWKENVVINSSLKEMFMEVVSLKIGGDQSHANALSPLNRFVDAFIFGSLGDLNETNDIVALYFLKAHQAYKKGNKSLINVRCCTHSSAVLSVFIYHYYKISGTNPIHGLRISHVNKWIVGNRSLFRNREVLELIDLQSK